MKTGFSPVRICGLIARAGLIVCFVFILSVMHCANIYAQQRTFTRKFPTRNQLTLRLNNWAGKVDVKGCECSEIQVKITIESRGTKVNPQIENNSLVIDLGRDNPGADDVGNVNFEIRMPVNSAVDVETRVGDINVSDIRGSMIRAHVTEGDISILNSSTGYVIAENQTGTITFDGDLKHRGNYQFTTVNGDINLRIPADSAFHLEATAPMSRSITLGSFAGASFSSVGGGRKIVGGVGDGQATVNVMNMRGRISFICR